MPAQSSQSDGQECPTSETSLNFAQNQRGELRTSEVAMQLTTGGGKPGEGYSAVLQVLTSGPAASPARTSRSLASAPDSLEPGVASPSPSWPLWSDTDLLPSSSKTYRDSSPVVEARILGRSSVAWSTSGMAWRTGFSTLNSSECPSADDESSSLVCEAVRTTLTDILLPSAPPRFSLSARAAQGILRRASNRGRSLPPELEAALVTLSQQDQGSDSKPKATTSQAASPLVPRQDETSKVTPNSSQRSAWADEAKEPEAVTTTPLGPSRDSSEATSDREATASEGSVVAAALGGNPSATRSAESPTSSVRRLTPTECERLQGWPDGWTSIPKALTPRATE